MLDNKVIIEIQKIREKNNVSWMNILRIALKYSNKETKTILKEITKNDKKVSKLVERLTIDEKV